LTKHTKLTPTRAIPRQGTSRTAFVADPPDPDDPLLGFDPYIHKQPRRNSITPDRQRAFIAALAATGIVTQAALEIGASLEALYKLRLKPGAENFARAWELAIDAGIARLEDCALERALLGEERPVVSAGKLVTTYKRYDTQLLLFLLRQRRGHRYAPPGKVPVREEEESVDDIIAEIDAQLDRMAAADKLRKAGQLQDDWPGDD
jgi:hypothetical protein